MVSNVRQSTRPPLTTIILVSYLLVFAKGVPHHFLLIQLFGLVLIHEGASLVDLH